MAEITASMVKELREATNVSMMECKRALVEANADMEQATKLLRERGIAVAAKKSSRTANQGLIASASSEDGKTVSLIEVNCETDFVARNDNFINFVNNIAKKALNSDECIAESLKDEVTAKVVEVGENIILKRNDRFVLDGAGAIQSYIHLGGKVGVLIELGCEKEETTKTDVFQELVKDLTLHIAATNPEFLTSADVPDEKIKAEREIFAKQVEDKPAAIIDKIVDGKVRKFLADICFVEQGFVKEPKQSISELLKVKSKELGDTLTIRRFIRYQLGM